MTASIPDALRLAGCVGVALAAIGVASWATLAVMDWAEGRLRD